MEETGASLTNYTSIVCNVTDQESVDAAIRKIVETYGRIDLLWNNAGYQGEFNYTLDYNEADFSNVMEINVTGMFIILQAVARQMISQGGGGAMVNTASVAGLRGTPGMIAYATSKAAVIAMTVTAAKDLAPHQIRVNALSPALIGPGTLWERQNRLHAELGAPYYATEPEQVAQNKVNSVPMKRLGSEEEVVKSLAFLLSDDASYTTGTNLVVDGGMSAGIK